jgi:hypothetical protein
MKAVTIRKDGKLLCFGPDDGNYEPGVQVDAVRAVEDDYNVILAEWNADRALDPKPPTELQVFANQYASLGSDVAFLELFKANLANIVNDPAVKLLLKDAVK